MTLTLIARNPYTRQIGVAIASGSDDCAGGSLYMDDALGIVSVQGKGDRDVGARALSLVAAKMPSDDILHTLQTEDRRLELRQVLIAPFDADLRAVTGGQCLRWAGHIAKDHHLVAGNMLSSEKVLTDMEHAYLADMNAPLRKRLFDALAAGIAAGGDLRGHQSAGIFIVGAPSYQLKVTHSPQVLDALAAGMSA